MGEWGEKAAAAYLQLHGWTILDQNYRSGHKEIDLVARRGEVVAFVEVKTRRSNAFGHPLESVDSRKRREIDSAAARWLLDRGSDRLAYRFDVVSVLPGPDGTTRIEHLENAWSTGD